MTSEELRVQIATIIDKDRGWELALGDALIPADAILSLLETAITEMEPTARSDQYSYEAGVADYKSNLLALVRGERV